MGSFGANAGGFSGESDAGDGKYKARRRVSDSHTSQISVLRALAGSVNGTEQVRAIPINEIAERSGLGDEKEVQRYLFILEGQKLVSPFPEGDFTSKNWTITRTGVRALRTVNSSTVY